MAKSPAAHSDNIEIVPATQEQQPILDNLLQLYAHDFMDLCDVELDTSGRFIYKNLPLYWSDPDRHPFLIKVNGQLAGFVLIRRGSEVTGDRDAWDVVEFFVLRGFRRRGIGTRATHQVWRRFPGRWEARVLKQNSSALRFWRRAIRAFTGKPILPTAVEYDGDQWKLFCFECEPTA
jgi:predicted acetyltransferase